MTGQCDHIVGFLLADYPQYGEQDMLVRASEAVTPSESFAFCPVCGEGLFQLSRIDDGFVKRLHSRANVGRN